MRISDWSSDVCSSDLQQLDEAGRSDAAVFQSTLRYVDIGDDSQADSGQDHGLVHGDVYTIEVSSANRWLGKAHQDVKALKDNLASSSLVNVLLGQTGGTLLKNNFGSVRAFFTVILLRQ